MHHGLWQSGSESSDTAVRQLVDAVARRAGAVRGSAICDLGCGYGATAAWLTSLYGARVTGITLSAVQFRYARQKYGQHGSPRFLLGDWLRSGLPAGSFDAVLAVESTEHFAAAWRI